ncbi:MAG TPA: hypothetical protein VF627_03815 [Abditibacterium sp.]|jgi:hypothetical protein
MIDSFLSFLGHGGFKLLIVAVVFVAQFLKARSKIAKKREAELRGTASLNQIEMQTPISSPTSIAGSPWSNLDAFDGQKP